VVELKKVQFMQKHLGEEFDGYISGVTAFGLFVELEELFVEGLIHITALNDDLYTHMEKQHSLVGRHLKRVFRIGDRIRVSVAAVSPATRRIEFALVNHSASAPPAKGSSAAVEPEEYPHIPVRGKRISSGPHQPGKGDTTGRPTAPGRPARKKRR
jgi:ribonuclease R